MKIAIIGTAPQQLAEAPFHDPSWQIWAVPGCFNADEPERNAAIDRVYEIHSPENMAISCETKEGFVEFAKKLKSGFVLREQNDNYPDARVFDYKRYVERHGRAPFSCSVAWMMAEAIFEVEGMHDAEIGLWGVNMAHDTEYGYQKPGARQMIGYAQAKGIKVHVPNSSELMSLPYLYGVEDVPPIFKILSTRTKGLKEKVAHYEVENEVAAAKLNYLTGAEDALAGKVNADLVGNDRKQAQSQFDDSRKMMDILRGALEEHIWVETNFFKSGG